MTYAPDYTAITNVFTLTWIAGSRWIMPLTLIFFAMVFITRDVEKWKILFFPMSIMFTVMGLDTHPAILMAGGIVFVIETLSTQVIGNWINNLRNWEKRRESEKVGNLERKSKIQEYKRRLGQIRTSEEQKGYEEEEMRKYNTKTTDLIEGLSMKLGKLHPYRSGEKPYNPFEEKIEKDTKERRNEREERRKNKLTEDIFAGVTIPQLKRKEEDKENKPKTRKTNLKESWEYFKERGSIGKVFPKGTLKEVLISKSRKLGRSLTETEIEREYKRVGRTR